jgi:predicted regulator of Ras-like GTPase activity (Roadblock/LC7/MglB family)
MSELAHPTPLGADRVGLLAESPPSRARVFTETLVSLAHFKGVRGGLLVAPDGLVITSTLPGRAVVEALGAVGASLGRELERGADRFGRGELKTAVFAAAEGIILLGASLTGFLILLADRSVDVTAVRAALRRALPRLQGD